MKFTLSEISTLQIGVLYGPYALTRDQKLTARASITNYKSKWPGSDFVTTTAPIMWKNPDGEEIQLLGWYQFWVRRTAYGQNIQTGEKEPLCNTSTVVGE